MPNDVSTIPRVSFAWELIGGHPALDFLNTVEDFGGPDEQDTLHQPADLTAWGLQAGLLERPVRRQPDGADELSAALDLRRHLFALVDARVSGRRARPADLSAVARAVSAAHAAGALRSPPAVTVRGGRPERGLEWHWDPHDVATVRHRVAASANDLLGHPAHARIGRCDGIACGWFFLDVTKRGNRRWCSMRDCGQDAKTARRRVGSGASAPLTAVRRDPVRV